MTNSKKMETPPYVIIFILSHYNYTQRLSKTRTYSGTDTYAVPYSG